MRDDFEFNSLFCSLVEQQPALYDFTRSDYSNRSIQDAIWQGIASELNQSAGDCKDRWRNIRARYGKNMKARESGTSTKFIKEYYLAPQLRFLDNFMKFRNPKDKEYRETDPSDAFENTQDTSQFSPPSPTQYNQTEYKNDQSEDYVPERKIRLVTRCSNDKLDPDMAFLRSLLPDMKTMTSSQKIKFKIGVLKVAREVLEENDEASSSNSKTKKAKCRQSEVLTVSYSPTRDSELEASDTPVKEEVSEIEITADHEGF